MGEEDFLRNGVSDQATLFDLRAIQREVRGIKDELYKLDVNSLMVINFAQIFKK